ncbi:hypothetical protein LCGC14_2754790 [marine sediment metagenome]|uniref:HK97 gp10 family phage protein n=1 Tax=marine sediment metagenome TaxID=412755 RepID=A0A0F8Z0V1_9ZZZZ
MAKQVKWNDKKLTQQIEAAAGDNILKAVLIIERDAKKMVAVDTGRLRSSITHEIIRYKRDVIGKVGTNVNYAIAQEYGTSRMSAHPYLRPALAKNLTRIRQLFGRKR